MNAENTGRCNCPHHKAAPFFVFLIGLTVLLGNLEVISMNLMGILWPSFLGLAGLSKMFSGGCKCCSGCGCCGTGGMSSGKC